MVYKIRSQSFAACSNLWTLLHSTLLIHSMMSQTATSKHYSVHAGNSLHPQTQIQQRMSLSAVMVSTVRVFQE